MNDPFGAAIQDFYRTGKAASLTVNTNYTENDNIPVSYFFRTEKEMPELERTALKLSKGKILDVGAAAGCHSIVLQQQGHQVTALECSPLAGEVLRKRGISKVITGDFFAYSAARYDTILLLMNGAGIGGTIEGLKKLFIHLKQVLEDDGQVLLDSSDIKYLFEEEDGSYWIDLSNERYYGEMEYEVSYKNHTASFPWLFVDFNTLSEIARQFGYSCTLIQHGPHYDYLAQIKRAK